MTCIKYFDKLMTLFKIISVYKSSLVIIGNFNIYVGNILDPCSTHFSNLMKLFDLYRHVQQPTHNCGHMLNMIITYADTQITELYVDPPIYSDHSLITCKFLLCRYKLVLLFISIFETGKCLIMML